MIREYINIVESMDKEITDEWFAHGSFETYKHPTPIHYKTAIEPGTIETLEGPVDYHTGYKIITGPKGEQYPVNPEKFADYYDDNEDGMTLHELAAEYGVSAERIRQIEVAAMKKMKAALLEFT